MKYNSIYNKFSSGELSPYLKGRTDLEEYYSGVDEMTNFIPLKQGGAYFRPGTARVVALDSSFRTFEHRIFNFIGSNGISYILFASPRISLAVLRTDSDTFCTVTQPNQPWNTRPDFSDTAAPLLLRGDTLDNMYFTSYGDIIVICDGNGDFAPIVIKRTGDADFIVDSLLWPTVIDITTGTLALDISAKYPVRFPYKDPNIDPGIRLKPSGTSGNITITAQNSAATPIDFFSGDVVGTMVKITHSTTTGIARITSKVSDSVVNAQVVIATFGATTASDNWETSAFNPVDGYPKSAAFHQGRLYFGGNKTYSDSIWASLLGNIYQFMQRRLAQDSSTNVSTLNYFGSVKNTDPFSFTIAATVASEIRWMYPSDYLLIGTETAEYTLKGGTDEILSVFNIDVSSISSHGSAKVQPVKVGSAILFVSFDRKRILEIPKDLRQYQSATELSSISEGILDKLTEIYKPTNGKPLFTGIQEMSYQESEATLWCRWKNPIDFTSGLLSLTMDRTSKTLGWAKHTFKSGTESTQIKGICCAPIRGLGNKDFLHLYLLRYIGTNEHTFERMFLRTRKNSINNTVSFTSSFAAEASTYLDHSVLVTALSNNVSLSGLGFSTQPVSVVDKNGNYLGDFTPSGGIIVVPDAAIKSPLLIGYKYSGEIKTMPIEAGAQFGTAQGSARRGHEISVFLDRSRGGKYKQSKAASEYPLDETGTGAALFTGEKKLSLNASPDDNQTVLKQDQPYPLTILWMLTKGYTYDA